MAVSEKRKVLLVIPEGTRRVYLETNVRVGAPLLAPLGPASIAGALRRDGHEVRILDLDLADVAGGTPEKALDDALAGFAPGVVGLASITPTWNAMMRAAERAKLRLPDAVVVCGGVHPTLFPEETLAGGSVDCVIRGEADFALNELLEASSPADVPGAVFRSGGETIRCRERPLIGNLDDLPFPAWELYDLRRYRMSHLTERRRPGGCIETSRGCPFGCIYCDKAVFGRRFRAKSPERVAAEFESMAKRHGFRELHVIDDGFSTDLDRAKNICRLLINRGINVPFNLFNGVRADRFDDELCGLLRRAGCYQVAFGVESGSDTVLESVSKGLRKDDVRRAVALCRKHKLETFGFFMIGFPGDTRETIRETVEFAVALDMTISKFDIAVPLPGTPMFEELDSRGLIVTRDWRRYIFHGTDAPLFDHPNLSREEIDRLYHFAFRRVYLRPQYIMKRFVHGLATGGLWHDIVCFSGSKWR